MTKGRDWRFQIRDGVGAPTRHGEESAGPTRGSRFPACTCEVNDFAFLPVSTSRQSPFSAWLSHEAARHLNCAMPASGLGEVEKDACCLGSLVGNRDLLAAGGRDALPDAGSDGAGSCAGPERVRADPGSSSERAGQAPRRAGRAPGGSRVTAVKNRPPKRMLRHVRNCEWVEDRAYNSQASKTTLPMTSPTTLPRTSTLSCGFSPAASLVNASFSWQ